MKALVPALFALFAAGCAPRVRVIWHKSQPVQGEPQPRATLTDVLKYGAAAISPEVAAVIAVEKIISGVSADWRTRQGETLILEVPAPRGAGLALRAGSEGRPEQVLILPSHSALDPEETAELKNAASGHE